ncbi:erythromycin esterase family protein [Sabulicella glaciei]|uniref:Erythromycin esterase family protein n=1 Tax=Sabulicella glaciei TaxID=2984948 RepID=A0ABT3NUU1_9PROT|nr:erythromycin esterase family protein [Roseococcus sp. MDT2-1-1]MCW8085921.1 erythromycin esterase family protein [Roseococcus sp. MDT2-1-1]
MANEAEIRRVLTGEAEALPRIGPDLAAAFDRFADARVVLLGEATHGTHEFYAARAAITRRLVERHGFSVVAVEADWPDAAVLDRWVRNRGSGASVRPPFSRFPLWMWRNEETRDFARWLRAHNDALPPGRRVAFRGLDIYSLGSSIEAVLEHLDEHDPEEARAARRRYGCLTPWQAEPADYGRAVLFGDRHGCEDAAVAQLQSLLEAGLGGEDWLFDTTQNARVVRSAEQYYRLMFRSGTESWNLRDRHMFDTLRAALDHAGPDAKAVVWAHNSHIGNAAATAMGWQGEFNIGELCRTAFGTDAALIGFATDTGSVAAAHDWDGPMEEMALRPALPGSHEARLREALPERALLDLRGPALRDALAEPALERAVGVVYRPATERRSHYFEAVLPEQFDALVWFAQTRAVTPLPPPAEEEATPLGA